MRPTRIRDLLLIAIFAAALGWALVRLTDSIMDRYPPVPWLAPATLALFGLALLLWTLGVRGRLLNRPGTKPLPPLLAARTAALALAASRTGALVAGGYLGGAMAFSSQWQNPAARSHGINALLSVGAAIAITVVALWLERICRLPEDPTSAIAADPEVG
jgi:hypothetical protein